MGCMMITIVKYQIEKKDKRKVFHSFQFSIQTILKLTNAFSLQTHTIWISIIRVVYEIEIYAPNSDYNSS